MGVYVQALQLIRENKLVLGDLSTSPKIDLCIDGADEVTPELDCIKGGGGCHVQEKIVAYNSATFVVRRPQPRSIALPTSPVTPRRVATGLGNFLPPTLTRLALLGVHAPKVVCDASKCSEHLGQNWRRGVPIEIIPLATEPITLKLQAMGGECIHTHDPHLLWF